MQGIHPPRGPCHELYWVVVRMTALGYNPPTVQACTGIPETVIQSILGSFFASGHTLPVPTPDITQSLYPQPSAHSRVVSGGVPLGVPGVRVATPPPPGQAPFGQGTPTQQVHSDPRIMYWTSPSQRLAAAVPQTSPIVQSTPVTQNGLRPPVAPHSAKSSPVKASRATAQINPALAARSPSLGSIVPKTMNASPAKQTDLPVAIYQPNFIPDSSYDKVISGEDIKCIWYHIQTNPKVTVRDLHITLLGWGLKLSLFQLVRALRNHKITISNVDSDPNKVARDEYAFHVGEFMVNQLVFIGQVSCDDDRAGLGLKSAKLMSETSIRFGLLTNWNRFMVCFALSYDGVIALRVSTTDAGERMYGSFIQYALGWLQAFPKPSSVVVLNRRGVSEGDKILEDIKSCRIKHLFLPPGSSDYNPTKQAVALIKSNIDGAQKMFGEAETKEDVETILHHNVFNIQKERTQEWFRECGYA
ncbi:hypothetical protein FRC09_009640 [Ceratobasidium sp. 395]|nr:hypothetical protein FRC09_009640 [Ceratobasidium sp. 395]